jgi:hypothetical protein
MVRLLCTDIGVDTEHGASRSARRPSTSTPQAQDAEGALVQGHTPHAAGLGRPHLQPDRHAGHRAWGRELPGVGVDVGLLTSAGLAQRKPGVAATEPKVARRRSCGAFASARTWTSSTVGPGGSVAGAVACIAGDRSIGAQRTAWRAAAGLAHQLGRRSLGVVPVTPDRQGGVPVGPGLEVPGRAGVPLPDGWWRFAYAAPAGSACR